MRQPSGCGIWDELKLNCVTIAMVLLSRAAACSFCRVLRSILLLLLLSHNSDFQSVNRLPKSIVVLLFTVVICVLFVAVACVAML